MTKAKYKLAYIRKSMVGFKTMCELFLVKILMKWVAYKCKRETEILIILPIIAASLIYIIEKNNGLITDKEEAKVVDNDEHLSIPLK